VKNEQIRDFVLITQANIIIFQEVNVNWNLLPWKDRWEERSIDW